MKKRMVLTTLFILINLVFVSSSFSNEISRYDMVFLRNLGGSWNVWVYKFDTKELQQVTFTSEDDSCPVWTRDKQGIAFIRDGDIYHYINGKTELLVDGGCYRYLSYDRKNDRLIFSWFVKKEECDIGYYDFKANKVGIVFTRNRQQVHPKVSYDGQYIYFDECYLSKEYIVVDELYRFDCQSKQLTVFLKADRKAFYRPAPNPKCGENISFVSNRSGRAEIYLAFPNGDLERISEEDSFYNDFPSWSPDGNMIYYTSLIGNKLKMVCYNVENKKRQILDITGECRESDL